ncbi:peroxisomal membrane protein PEX14 [Hetaerina americana]|uniref:peroxisomal membrane protein PEX14 n=1 Tax=Hetaerina americana TaxID=62018 RepID=UPI003A7F4CF6
MEDSPQPRENIISTAVNFLQNPKVQSSSREHQQAFLKRKGLSDEEIGIAFDMAQGFIDKRVLVPSPSTVVPIPQQLVLPIQSRWARLWDFFNTLMLVSGVSYSLYCLYKKYLEPLIFGKKDKKPTVEETVPVMQESLKKSAKETKENFRRVLEILDTQHQELLRIALYRQNNTDLHGDAATQRNLHELKAEVASIKGILLNRKQFPSTPNPSPSIPAWQMPQDNGANTGTRGESAESSSPTSEFIKVQNLEELCASGSSETVMINKSEVTGEGSDSSLEMVRE